MQAYAATFNAGSTPGVFSNTITFTSLGDDQSLPGANPPGPLSLSITGNVYSGKAQWNTASGVWGTSGNWQDTVGGGPSGAPGLAGYATDTATFGTSAGSGTVVVSLDSAAPVLSDLVFNNSNANFAILQGTGATGLTFSGTDGSSPAALTVIGGEHWVETPILLNSNLEVGPSGSLTLGGNISDGGLAKGLTLDGPGTLILSGTNSYSGGTTVNGGVLYLTSSASLPSGSSLTVAAGGTLIFDPSVAMSPPGGDAAGESVSLPSAVSPVPEPGTLAILAVAAICCLAARSWRRSVGLFWFLLKIRALAAANLIACRGSALPWHQPHARKSK